MGYRLRIQQGATFSLPLRWEVEPFIYKTISSVKNSAPVQIVCPAHGLLPNQPFAIQNVGGMVEINTTNVSDVQTWYIATVVDPDTIEINRVNSGAYKPYTAGGNIVYRTVIDLSDYTARMYIKDKIGGTILHELSSPTGGITLDPATQYITLYISDEDTETFEWAKGVYDLEMVSNAGEVFNILSGDVVVGKEVTRP